MVLFDQDGIEQAHPVILAPTTSNRMLLRRAQPRNGLPRVQNTCSGVIECLEHNNSIILRCLSNLPEIIPKPLVTVNFSRVGYGSRRPLIHTSMRRLKLPNRFSSLAFAFYMATIIAFMMSVVLTAINTGIDGHFLARVLKAYVVAMPVAFTCVVFVRPLVLRLVAMTVEPAVGYK